MHIRCDVQQQAQQQIRTENRCTQSLNNIRKEQQNTRNKGRTTHIKPNTKHTHKSVWIIHQNKSIESEITHAISTGRTASHTTTNQDRKQVNKTLNNTRKKAAKYTG